MLNRREIAARPQFRVAALTWWVTFFALTLGILSAEDWRSPVLGLALALLMLLPALPGKTTW